MYSTFAPGFTYFIYSQKALSCRCTEQVVLNSKNRKYATINRCGKYVDIIINPNSEQWIYEYEVGEKAWLKNREAKGTGIIRILRRGKSEEKVNTFRKINKLYRKQRDREGKKERKTERKDCNRYKNIKPVLIILNEAIQLLPITNLRTGYVN